MRQILRIPRLIAVFAMIFIYLATMVLVWVFVRDRWSYKKSAARILHFYSGWTLFILGVRVRVEGKGPLPHNALLVGNHLSYLDVIVITSVLPSAFVTSTEVRDSFGLGHICKMAGCLFVDRKSKRNIHAEVAEVAEALRQGLNVAIFPEATSSNGAQVLRFRRPLYVGAIDSGRDVNPFCLNYQRVGGVEISAANRDQVFWYGDMDFLPHLWALVGSGGVDVALHFLPPIPTQANTDLAELVAASQSAVEGVFCPV